MIAPIRFARNARLFSFVGILALGSSVLAVKTVHKAPPDPAVVAADPNVRQVASANMDFGFRLLTQLNKATPNSNIFFSPFSISDCLTMVLNGAGGTTQSDMASALGLKDMTLAQINQANGRLLPSLENPDPKVETSVANALWANTGTTFDATFQKQCATFYDARTDTLDFSSPAAADTINGWVKDNTHGKIDKLVSPADLAGSSAVLTNAVYFHGQWTHAFEKSDTENGPFTLAQGGSKTVPLMSRTGNYSYLETPEFQAISLPYGSGRMSMDVFLPKPGRDLSGVVNGLNEKTWDGWIRERKPTEMTIIMPRFKADYAATLNAPLTALGMGSAFSSGADFTPMGLSGSVISQVIHKAIIEVDEEGTVAAAATGVMVTASAEMPPKTVMRVDHPFFLAIRDNITGTLLFAGAIRDPK